MALDLRPPLAPFLSAFGQAVLGVFTAPGRAPVSFSGIWLPSRVEQFPISDSAVTDVMPVLAIPLGEVGDWVPEGARVEIPPMGQTVAKVYTVRRVYDRDAEWIVCGMAG